jgi:uncharacterized protein YndB with AHSA1/START domain
MLSKETDASNNYVIDQKSHTIRFERLLHTSRDEVFDAWTKPEEVSEWWDPDGVPLTSCEIDLRIGGSFSFVSRQHPEMPFGGIYREIVRPERLAFEAMGAMGHVVLRAVGDETNMTVEIVCRSAEHLEQFTKLGVAGGTSRTLDNLAARFDASDQ